MRSALNWLLMAMLFAASAASAQVRTAEERAAATVAAFNAPPEAFEAYARDAYSKGLLERASPKQRRDLVERLHGDFGTMHVKRLTLDSPVRLTIRIEGSTAMTGSLILDHEEAAPFRITALGIRAGGGGDQEGGPVLPPLPGISSQMSEVDLVAALDPYLQQLASHDVFSGAVLVAKSGKPLFERAYGLANRSDSIPNKTSTRFNIGSINKFFTKTAIYQLIAAGKLTLTDPIGKVLPDYPNAGARGATVEQLLEHRGGLADAFGPELQRISPDRFRSNHDWYLYVAPKPVLFEPGTKKEYCNSCYMVLGEMIERLTGAPYEQYIQSHIFDPAGMKASGFFAEDAIVPDVASGYTRHEGPTLRNNVLFRGGAAGSAAGGAYATASDLLAFDTALRSGKLLDPEMNGRFFGVPPAAQRITAGIGYAGGLEGLNAAVESDGTWTVIVLANLDPPAAEKLTMALHSALEN